MIRRLESCSSVPGVGWIKPPIEAIVLWRLVAGLEECGQEEHAEQHVDAAQRQILRMQAILEIEHEQGSAVAELLEDGRNHHRAKAHWVARNHDKSNLEGQSNAGKAVVKSGMRD